MKYKNKKSTCPQDCPEHSREHSEQFHFDGVSSLVFSLWNIND